MRKMEPNWDRVTELFKREFPEFAEMPGPVLEDLPAFLVFRLGYCLGGADGHAELAAELLGETLVRGG